MAVKEYTGVKKAFGPLIVLEGVKGAAYDELVEIEANGKKRLGKVITIDKDLVIIQIFEGTAQLSLPNTKVRFTGKPLEVKLSPDMLGRVFDGLGRPRDGLGEVVSSEKRDINGLPINPYSRVYPRNFIQTGISTIDALFTLIRGQKLPIFSGNGLPHNELAVQIARQSTIKEGEFVVVFAAIGLKNSDVRFILSSFEGTGASKNIISFLNLASDPVVERIATPRVALTVAEYFAFDLGYHVLVIMSDITNYCEALRELSNYRGEIPSRKGYPGYMYSDLATIYERAGIIEGKEGSLTQLPILTMPNDDITHPIPDLTGYITEGQIVLSRDLHMRGIYPPINVLSSLSRLMKDGIGEGYTREDHPNVASQLFAAYSRVQEVRSLASIIGEEELTDVDKAYLRFGESFEREFIKQDFSEDRSIEQTLDLAWKMLSYLPEEELTRVSKEQIDKYLKKVK
ncbi:MAG: V-type ATP synthase subunit B [Thermotogaceae bacterium]|nr:V-type ATP synthase subunit B [Thermotogaceae bacterium]